MSKLKRNIIANFLGRGWSAISVYIFVPFYVKFLGIESYGLVGFYAVLQGVFAFANFGLIQTLGRELARLSVVKDSEQEMRGLVRTLELLFLGVAVLISLIVALGAPIIAENWINAQGLDNEVVEKTVVLMGISIGLLFPFNILQGGLLGLQQQVKSNIIIAVMGTGRGLGALMVLWLVSPTVIAFFRWQIVINLIQAAVTWYYLWDSLPPHSARGRFRISVFRSIWRFAAGMTGITVISIVATQIDKLTVSKLLSLEILGYYSLATIISHVPNLFSDPVKTAVFPVLTQFAQLKDQSKTASFYHQSCQLLSTLVFPAGFTLTLFSKEIIQIWTQDPIIAENCHLIATLLVVGSICLSLKVIPFSLALAHGWTKLNIYMGTAMIVLIIPIMTLLVNHYGQTGAAIGWIIINGSTLPLYILILHNRYLPGETWRWYIYDIGIPLIAAFIPVFIGRQFIAVSMTQFAIIPSVALIWLLSTAASVAAVPQIRTVVIKTIISSYRKLDSRRDDTKKEY